MPAISAKMQDALNRQINAEMYSSHLYLAMSAYFEMIDLSGFANWMRVHSREEITHVDKLFDFILERGGEISLQAIAKPPARWESPLAAFQEAFEHEREISTAIDDLVGLALELKDRASESFLRWYVDEQVEEEATVDRVVKMLRLADGQAAAMLMLDREMATRMPVAPA